VRPRVRRGVRAGRRHRRQAQGRGRRADQGRGHGGEGRQDQLRLHDQERRDGSPADHRGPAGLRLHRRRLRQAGPGGAERQGPRHYRHGVVHRRHRQGRERLHQ